MIIFYNIVMNLLLVVFILIFPAVCLFSKKRRSNLVSRFGLSTAWKPKQPEEKRIWIHALSVGEVKSVVPLVKILKDRHGEVKIVFSTSTRTGFETAGRYFLTPGMENVDQLGYFPLDFSCSVQKISTLIGPDAVIIVETDIWPNFLYEMKKRRIPVVLINARLSKGSLNGYLRFKGFFLSVFSCFTQIMVQTRLDAERFLALGIGKEKIQVTGNMKFDHAVEDSEDSFAREMKKLLNIQGGTLVLVAGSTHEGEEKILCRVYEKLLKKYPGLVMILAPRDPGRCRALLPDISFAGIPAFLMSGIKEPLQRNGVVLVDKMGVLSRLYGLCHVAFIGGSLVKEGGHNPLEPAAFSKPILFGPDMSDFMLISKLLRDHGGAKQVDSEKELLHELDTLLEKPQVQKQMGQLNQEVFLSNCGAAENIVTNLEALHIV
ncbi:MAG: hypothetical protein A2277_02040 [Desulfobacterales bacterium RIFOXYA12_FULL_46_15]|nr:MAG: hypothetical protein A2277_02040 [Desulfobacterales bacterium RIFOXYA12_FULL_46_15]